MPGENSSETENPYGRMHVTELVRATIPVQNGARLSWDRSIAIFCQVLGYEVRDCQLYKVPSSEGNKSYVTSF